MLQKNFLLVVVYICLDGKGMAAALSMWRASFSEYNVHNAVGPTDSSSFSSAVIFISPVVCTKTQKNCQNVKAIN